MLSRDTNSGTHVFFKEHVVQMAGLPTQNTKLEYGSKVLFLPSTEEGVSEVARNANAIFVVNQRNGTLFEPNTLA
jgi:phosphate transport system substrate-binding protein